MARRGTVRARVDAMSAATSAPQRQGERKRLWRQRLSCRLSACLPTIAYTSRRVSTLALRRRRYDVRPCAARNSSTSIHWGRTSIFAVFREGDDLFGH